MGSASGWQEAHGKLEHASPHAPGRDEPERGEALGQGMREMGADEHALGRILALERRAERIAARRAHRPGRTGTSRATRSKRPAKCSPVACSTSSHPLARAGGTRARQSGLRLRSRRRLLLAATVSLVEHEQPRHLGRRRSHRGRARPMRSGARAPPRRPRRPRRAARGRRAASPRASRRTRATSWCGSLRTKPTVSVMR